ncbi:hypothetical protein DVH24_002251 [Malus domestica]|uniref:Ubiquitin-like protease family profile domain-containing protein n=1 Tax=Malus domestica TaxID=3750 RepID=A0A498IC75_MALDO|nr:hypothetical protein DVH24_002251 [Malus domestica]
MDAECVVKVIQYFYHFNKLKEKEKKNVMGKEVEFGASWVDKLYMPLNLDQHWVVVKMNLKVETILMYD